MIECFKSNDGRLSNSELSEKNNWISLTNPTIDEISEVSQVTGVLIDFVNAALDPEEISRIEEDENQVLILANASFEEINESEHLSYTTLPVGIIITQDHVITVSIDRVRCIEYFKKSFTKGLNTSKKTRFTLQIIYQMAAEYLVDLRKLDLLTEQIESYLHVDMKNDYLIELLTVEKNLVYFSTSLKRNENLVKKIARTNVIERYEEDEDLLEDTLIEIQQANEMANINSQIIRSIREAFGAIISNNLNTIMKILASLTIILTIPTMIYSFFGMNTSFGEFQRLDFATPIVLLVSLGFTLIVYLLMRKSNMF